MVVVYGVDFTSAPRSRKPIKVARCRFDDDGLCLEGFEDITDFDAFDAFLRRSGPWVAGFDFPFAQSRKFVKNIRWPQNWAKYVELAGRMDRAAFRATLEAYKAPRRPGDREHSRAFEAGTGAASPQKLYGVPVGLMFHAGAPRLLASGAHLPGLCDGDRSRVCLEAYPGVAARAFVGRRPYKSDTRAKQTAQQAAVRRDILHALTSEPGRARFGFQTVASDDVAEDPSGDSLDALLCAVQAGWALRAGFADKPPPCDPLEGWIADPEHVSMVFHQNASKGQTVTEPVDAKDRRAVAPVICYPTETLPEAPIDLYRAARMGAVKIGETVVPPREARSFHVGAGQFFRISSVEGPQVGDLNLWNARDLSERFYSGKTRALHGTHLSEGDRMWSSFPALRPMATITEDTLGWYGIDAFGGSVHDVIGTRCDPYTGNLLSGSQYHHCCHSNLTRAVTDETGLPLDEAERHVHDVLNVFMCTGFTRDTGQYFMKASPVRPGDFIEFFAEIDLLGALSACPGGDCSAEHSSDTAPCHPLLVEVFAPEAGALGDWKAPPVNGYDRSHGRP